MLLTPANLQFAFNAFDQRFQAGYTMADPFFDKLATQVPSNTEQTVYGWIGKLPKMREWNGERVANNPSARSYTIVNKTFEDTVKIPREKFEDDQYGIFMPMISLLGMEAARLPDRLIAGLLDNGNAATSVCFDGQPFFSANHPTDPDNASSATQSNLFSPATSGTMPLNGPNLATVITAMMNYKGEDGLPLGVMPNLLVVGPSLKFTAMQLLNTSFIAPAAAFGANAANTVQSNPLQGVVGLLVVPWLTDQTSWYVMDTTKPVRPLIYQLRRPLQATYLNQLTDANVFWRKEFAYGVDLRANAGYGLWFHCAKCTP